MQKVKECFDADQAAVGTFIDHVQAAMCIAVHNSYFQDVQNEVQQERCNSLTCLNGILNAAL